MRNLKYIRLSDVVKLSHSGVGRNEMNSRRLGSIIPSVRNEEETELRTTDIFTNRHFGHGK